MIKIRFSDAVNNSKIIQEYTLCIDNQVIHGENFLCVLNDGDLEQMCEAYNICLEFDQDICYATDLDTDGEMEEFSVIEINEDDEGVSDYYIAMKSLNNYNPLQKNLKCLLVPKEID